ncbi:MAG TPA: type II secretion system minor pseudopilin GspI [Candidatus Limnocylindrales bacterium]|nr:type II secretion system minor pseudopilin GspI [Candidatus Limnocylindrales bacterium]
MRNRKNRTSGFTLLEVLVALAILSGTLIMAYRVMSEAISAEERSERWTAASYLGEALLRDATSSFPEVGESEGRFPGLDNAYAWKRNVKAAAHPDAREVDVTVSWGEGDRAESVALAGIAFK